MSLNIHGISWTWFIDELNLGSKPARMPSQRPAKTPKPMRTRHPSKYVPPSRNPSNLPHTHLTHISPSMHIFVCGWSSAMLNMICVANPQGCQPRDRQRLESPPEHNHPPSIQQSMSCCKKRLTSLSGRPCLIYIAHFSSAPSPKPSTKAPTKAPTIAAGKNSISSMLLAFRRHVCSELFSYLQQINTTKQAIPHTHQLWDQYICQLVSPAVSLRGDQQASHH